MNEYKKGYQNKKNPFKIILDDVLKYQGPVFSRWENMENKDDSELFRRDDRYCERCEATTRHERVRNLWTYYWRCENCLDRDLREKGYFIPPYQRTNRMGNHITEK